MSLGGGAADKVGNRYEDWWAVRCLLDVLDGQAAAVRFEPPGVIGEGVEFVVFGPEGHACYHQAKRQNGIEGRWTIGALATVLGHFGRKLTDVSATCTFVSQDGVRHLGALTARARDSSSFEEFEEEFLSTNRELPGAFQEFTRVTATPDHRTAWQALRRIRIETITEATLRDWAHERAAALLDAPSGSPAVELAQYARDSVHQTRTADDILQYLRRQGFRLRQWWRDATVRGRVEELTEQYLDGARQGFRLLAPIPRAEAQQVLQRLLDPNGPRCLTVIGGAGVGKTSVLEQAVSALVGKGVPILALRLDRLRAFTSADELGQIRQLPGPPARVLGTIARGQPAVLVLDQVDAFSVATGRAAAALDVVGETLRQAQQWSGLRVLVACRSFDLAHDARLRSVLPGTPEDTVEVERLDEATVVAALAKAGLTASDLRPEFLAILAVPLHLALLLQIAQDRVINLQSLRTRKDLFDAFWSDKRRRTSERLDGNDRWSGVLDTLSVHLSEAQALTAPWALLDPFEHTAAAMVSEGVLVRQEDRVLFFHDAFFDYVYARSYSRQPGDLLALLRSDEQHLFRRAQVRAILLYERDADHLRYLADLQAVLTASDVRPHIKEVVLAFLGGVEDPRDREWAVLASLAEPFTAPLAKRLWSLLGGAPAWFDLLDRQGLIERRLADHDEAVVDHASWLLGRVVQQRPDQVAAHLASRVGGSGRWPTRLCWVMQLADLGASRALLDVFLAMIDAGDTDATRGGVVVNSDFWGFIHGLPRARPDWACEVIGRWLRHRITPPADMASPTSVETWSLKVLPSSRTGEQLLAEAATGAPSAFVQEVLPAVLKIGAMTARPDRVDGLRQDAVWSYRTRGESYTFAGELLRALEQALRAAVAAGDEQGIAAVRELAGLDLEIAQLLAACGFAAGSPALLDDAVAWLCDASGSLATGYSEGAHELSRQVVEAVMAHCSSGQLQRLSARLLNYWPDWETRPGRGQYRGSAQFILLAAIPADRRPVEVVRRLQELQRKFGREHPPEPDPGVQVGEVRSPIPEHAPPRMSDEQWLAAMRRYPDDSGRTRPDFHIGGAFQVATQLQQQVEADPERFTVLLERLPSDVAPEYAAAILQGLQEGAKDPLLVVRACRAADQRPGRPHGQLIAGLVGSIAATAIAEDLVDELVGILTSYAINDPDPEQDTPPSPNQESWLPHGQLDHAAVNSVRGQAVLALGELALRRLARFDHILPLLAQAARDRTLTVRTAVLQVLARLPSIRLEQALHVLLQCVEDSDVALLDSAAAERVAARAGWFFWQQCGGMIERMATASAAGVARRGALAATIASLNAPAAEALVARCQAGPPPQRLGVAQGIGQLAEADLGLPAHLIAAAVALFDDSDSAVRGAAADIFSHDKTLSDADFEQVLQAFAVSAAFADNSREVFSALQRTRRWMPTSTLDLCERYLDLHAAASGDISTAQAAAAPIVSELTLRVYAQETDETLRSRCLDIIDRMTLVGSYGLDRELAALDR
jgi:hypothetical protein